MFGLFMLLPVLAIHTAGMPGSTPLKVGIALGAYGLTQALLQIPFGLLSDRLGRKKLITTGLLIFILGSIVAAAASSIEWIIAGRAIQGAGAISSVILALTADLTREEQRTKAMAIIGMSIGVVFLLSITLAPPLAEGIGVQGLFILTGILAVLAIIVLHTVVPSPDSNFLHRDVVPVWSQISVIARNPQLLQLDFGIFVLHLVLTALFVVIPGQLVTAFDIALAEHWKIYLPIIVLSVAGMVPLIMISSRKGRAISAFRFAIAILSVGLAALALSVVRTEGGLPVLLVSLWLFFVGFNALEAMLPSLVSRVAPAAAKGTAIGIYNSCQFAGVFAGGMMAGFITEHFGTDIVFWLCGLLCLCWLLLAVISGGFQLFSSRVLYIGEQSLLQTEALVDRIRQVRGVKEVTIVRGESLAYLKVDDKELDTAALHQLKQT